MDIRRRMLASSVEGLNIDNYLTIEANEDGLTASLSVNACEYCVDGDGNWKTLSDGTATESINSGHSLSFRGNLTPNDTNGIGTFTMNKKCNLKGNCMSMLFGDNAADNYSLSGKNYAFYKLFYNCNNIVNVSSNFLPATTLAYGCYEYMFTNCTNLTTAPELSATTLANRCYADMFYGCTSLTKAPELPSTTLVNNCYYGMFVDCTSLITAPSVLPATTLADYCYYYMFYGCTSLTRAPELPATTLKKCCYDSMFYGCSSLTTAPALPATTLAQGCYGSMFRGCSSLTTAPKLLATTLAYYCYQGMFYGCSSLTTAPELPATTLAEYCYEYMFYNCTSLNYIKCLATDISVSDCTYDWVNGVASTGTFVKAADMTGWTTSSSGIPNGWTVEEYIDYTKESLTFNILSAGTINWTTFDSSASKTIEYKLNNGGWKSITSTASGVVINVKAGDEIQFRGNNATYNNNTFKGSTAEFEIEGNIMSLINPTDFSTLTTLESNFTFINLFTDCTGLTSAENLILPADTLADYCYAAMFQNCTSLTTAPELPAMTLADRCYLAMFQDCTSLTTAPELPATKLVQYCYFGMFQGCTSLTTAPELPAMTLVEGCYHSMFYGCTKLNYIKCLATDISATDCTSYWVDRVASTGTFVKAAGMTSWETGTSGIPSGWTVEDNQEPLTFKISSPGTINWTATNSSLSKTIEYKLNDGEWKTITSNTGSSAPTITVNSGDKIQFKGNNTQYATSYSNCNSFSGSTALFEVEGNIMSLIYGDEFKNKLTISSTYAFYGLFKNCTGLTSAKNLILPSTTLANYCYAAMFQNCTSLTTAPVLPATTLAEDCYQYMFQGCTSLKTAPALPATTLAPYCYQYMFKGCTSLTTAPELPATTLGLNCYSYMFNGCTSLTTAPALPATTLKNYCYSNMFNGCSKLTTAPALPATTLANYCYWGMFQNCTSLTTAPELPATTLATYCYWGMFQNCTSLNYIKCLATNISATNCTKNWVYGVASTGTFVKNPNMAEWTTGSNGIPNGWTKQNA